MDHYIIRVEPCVPEIALAAFEGLVVTQQTAQTVLLGELPDQAALAGVLDHLDELGVVILEVLKIPDRPESVPGEPDVSPQ